MPVRWRQARAHLLRGTRPVARRDRSDAARAGLVKNEKQNGRQAREPTHPAVDIVEVSIEDVRCRACLLARTARDESLQVAGGLRCPLGRAVAGGEMDVAAKV